MTKKKTGNEDHLQIGVLQSNGANNLFLFITDQFYWKSTCLSWSWVFFSFFFSEKLAE